MAFIQLVFPKSVLEGTAVGANLKFGTVFSNDESVAVTATALAPTAGGTPQQAPTIKPPSSSRYKAVHKASRRSVKERLEFPSKGNERVSVFDRLSFPERVTPVAMVPSASISKRQHKKKRTGRGKKVS